MGGWRKIGLVVILAIVIVGAAIVWDPYKNRQDERVYRIGYGEDIPFHFRGADGQAMGIAVEIVKTAAARSGIRVEFREPAHSGLQGLQLGEVDMWVLLTDLPERHQFVHFTEPYLTTERCFVILTENKSETIRNLSRARIGYRASRSTQVSAAAAEINPNSDLIYLRSQLPQAKPVPIPYDAGSDMWRRLDNHSVDALFLNRNVATALLLTGENRERMELFAASKSDTQAAIASSFAAAKAADRIRDGIRSMADDGSLADVVERSGFFHAVNLNVIRDLSEARRVARTLAFGSSVLLVALVVGAALGWRVRRQRDVLSQTQAALQEATQRLVSISSCLPDVMWSVDLTQHLTYVSPSVERIYGWTVEEALQLKPDQLATSRSLEKTTGILKDLLARIAAGDLGARDPIIIEVEHLRKDGSEFWVEVNAVLTFSSDGRPIGVTGVSRDISERKRAEEERDKLRVQLAQAQKMESIGRLAGGVAHDFNNLLTVINGYSDLLQGHLKKDDAIAADQLREIHEAGKRAAQLTSQLLAFSRKQLLQPQVLDLNRVMRGVRSLIERLMGEDVEVRFTLAPGALMVHADPHQLEQVVMNLAVNARDAMPQGGALIIETSAVELPRNSGAHSDIQAGHYALLAVSDTGVGMDEATRQQVFEPFFTTKQAGEGTGLGLSMVQGIIAQSGGHTSVYSELGHGTTFKVYLPALLDAAASPANAASRSTVGGHETILVVEDQENVRGFILNVLESYGYRAMGAADAEEGTAIVEREDAEIHLVLTDVVLPGVSGRELAKRLTALRPGIKTLFMSGYTGNVIARHGGPDVGLNFIQKPFSPEALASKIREVLRESATPS